MRIIRSIPESFSGYYIGNNLEVEAHEEYKDV